MKKSTIFVAGVLLAPVALPQRLLPALLLPAQAQPDVNNGGKAVNPANIQMGPGGGQNFRTMTPEQRQKALAARKEAVLRALLAQNGFNDDKIISAVVAYVTAQDKARLPIATLAQKLSDAMRDQALTDGQIGGLLNNLRVAVEDEKARSQIATKALDGQINYTKTPRLEALLTVGGIIGDEATFTGQSSLGNTGPGGMGGFGQGPGGGFGGGPGGGGGPNGGMGGGPGGGGPGGPGPDGNAPNDLAGFGQKTGQRPRPEGNPPGPPPGD